MAKYCDNCGRELEDAEVKNYTSKTGQKKLCNNCFNKYKTKFERFKKETKTQSNKDIDVIFERHKKKIEDKRIEKEWNDLTERLGKTPEELFEEEEKVVSFDKNKYNRALARGESEKSARAHSSVHIKDVKEKMDKKGLKIVKDNWERMKPEEKLRLMSDNACSLRLRYFKEYENISQRLINDILKSWDELDNYEKDAFAFLLHYVKFSKDFLK